MFALLVELKSVIIFRCRSWRRSLDDCMVFIVL